MSLGLTFKGIEAEDPVNLRLKFSLDAENHVAAGAQARIASWRVEVGGQEAVGAFSLDYPQTEFSLESSIDLALDMDITALAAKGLAPKDEYSITLITELEFPSISASHSASDARLEVRGLAVFAGVRPPVFSITEIAILQAELINTRLRVALRIDNPNPFPIELSSFSYSLYGNGILWADGIERNIFVVDGNTSLHGNLLLLMNFMGMNRRLLDQVIRLEDVRYNFVGRIQISTGLEYLPVFNHSFEISGVSRVFDR